MEQNQYLSVRETGRRPELSIVVFCHNEAMGIEAFLRQWQSMLREVVESYEIIVCNAGSLDGTGRVLDNLRREFSEIRVLHQLAIGYTRSIRRGFEASRGTFVLQLDGTGQNEPGDFAPLWELRNRYDLILGRRTHRLDSFFQQMFSGFLQKFVKLLFRVELEDINSAFRLFRRNTSIETLGKLPKTFESFNICLTRALVCLNKDRVHEIRVPYRLPSKGRKRVRLTKLLSLGIQTAIELIRFRLRLGKYLISPPRIAHNPA